MKINSTKKNKIKLEALKANIPEGGTVRDTYVFEFHSLVDALGPDFVEFKIPSNELKRAITHVDIGPEGERIQEYSPEAYCDREYLLTKLDGVLNCLHESSKEELPSKTESLNDLHPEVYSKCHKLFMDGALAECVEKGFKVVRDKLRELTGYETGSEAFGKTKLHIKGATAPHVDTDFNEAVKFLTMSIDRFRNEKSHTSNAKIDSAIKAHEYLRLSSLAMRFLDDAEIRP